MPFDLIIFDCDGTLVDSEYLHNKAVSDVLVGFGFTQFTPEHCLEAFAGRGIEACIAIIEEESGRKLPPNFRDDYVALVGERIATDLIVIEGVHDTLAKLKAQGVKMCVASNGEPENVQGLIKGAKLDDLFTPNLIFTKSQVKNAKPAPDLFLFAAKTMGSTPARTLVIEDSVTGATAGVAAGMTVIGLTAAAHDRPAQESALRTVGVHHLTDRFDDIIAFIERAKEKLRA